MTDDTDAATLESVRLVYDFLAAIGLKTSKTIWAFRPTEPCGIPPLPDSIQRGVTCEDPAYLAYCVSLRERGFEICLHGASPGNNPRERTAAGLTFLQRHFGPAGTWICHAKNAENPYWHEKVAPRGPAQALLALTSRYRCSGEDPASPYFWGDLCLDQVEHIRLFRTRSVDTLAANPSLPYHDPEKPFVRSWFSATKRSFHDCTTAEALARLCAGGGLCVLYQYMHRYADAATGKLKPGFRDDAERLMGEPGIWVETTSAIMRRRRAVSGLFAGVRDRTVWIANAGQEATEEVQLQIPAGIDLVQTDAHAMREGEIVRIRRIAPGSMVRIATSERVALSGIATVELDPRARGVVGFGFGRVFLNAGPDAWIYRDGARLEGASCRAEFEPAYERLGIFSRASTTELYRLLLEQLEIIGGEVLWKGRSLDSRRFLGGKKILLEDHDRW